MSAPSPSSRNEFDSAAASARDAYFTDDGQSAEDFAAAELAAPVRTCPAGEDPHVIRQAILQQTRRLETLLTLWRLQEDCADEFSQAYPTAAELFLNAPAAADGAGRSPTAARRPEGESMGQSDAMPAEAGSTRPACESGCTPAAPLDDYAAEVALQMFGNEGGRPPRTANEDAAA